MFGRLNINSIPYHEPIIVYVVGFVSVLVCLFVSYITYLKKWKYIWSEWITTVDHKKIGIMYIIVAAIMFIRGFSDAIMMRTQQFVSSSGMNEFLSPNHYNQIITAHGIIMIIFMAMPFIVGLMNIIVPLQIGAKDMAFPTLNSISFWLFMAGVLLINVSLGIGEFAQTGWTAYPPLSGRECSPGVGVDYWIWSIQISGIGTLLTGINFFVTIIRMRIPGMKIMHIPIFVWTALCTSVLIILSFPILTVTVMLLTLDRYLGTHFFTNDMGGNPMMYVNLFWAWGHPEVYILILPAFGIFSEIVPTFSKKSIFGYSSLVWATIVITFLSFCVWLHHFFTMGAGVNVNSFFGIMTMIIAVPTGVKIFNWLFTIYRGKVTFHSSMLWTIGFISTFSIGGMAGVLLAIPGIDFVLHNSVFLVAHFHNVIIGGVLFGCFAGLSYWFPKIFGFKLNELFGKISFFFWITGFYIAFFPLYILGLMGMTRRLSYNIEPGFHTMLFITLIGVILITIGIFFQIIQIIFSIKKSKINKDITGDPWDGRTLEWFTSSPPPHYNFSVVPYGKDMRDIFWKMKNKSVRYNLELHKQTYIYKSNSFGFFVFIFSFSIGFAMVWYIWWMAILGIFGLIFVWILNSLNKNYM